MKKIQNSKKAAVELSVNFIIGLIFGIVLFSFGKMFSIRMLNSSQDVIEQGLPSYFDALAEQCVQRGDKACLPEIKKEVRVREAAQFGLIINNILDSKANFQPVLSFSRGKLKDGSIVESSQVDVTKWSLSKGFKIESIKNNDHAQVEIPLIPPAGTKKGVYVFNVKICYSESGDPPSTCSGTTQYNPTLQMTVEVV